MKRRVFLGAIAGAVATGCVSNPRFRIVQVPKNYGMSSLPLIEGFRMQFEIGAKVYKQNPLTVILTEEDLAAIA